MKNQDMKMGKFWLVGRFYLVLLCVMINVDLFDSQEQQLNTYTISSFTYGKSGLKPYEWRYTRVELPPGFSSLSLALESNVDLDLNKIKNTSGSLLPMICFREGSLPLPDVHNTSLTGLVIDYISNNSFDGQQSIQNIQKCYPMQRNISLCVTNEQITPGTWYFGFFNGIGAIRTQSKMINRGSGFSFSGNISVEGCMTSSTFGQFCNQTLNMLSFTGSTENAISYSTTNGIVCQEDGEGSRIYTLMVVGLVEELLIRATNVTFNQAQPSNLTGLMTYARHEETPSKSIYDFFVDISKSPLVINFPKAGLWYITIQSIGTSNRSEGVQSNSSSICYLLEGQVSKCLVGKAGFNCTSQQYTLQTVVRRSPGVPLESIFLPISGKISGSTNFPLEPLLSNFSSGENASWTYFSMDIPSGGIGGNLHIHLTSNANMTYQIYVKYGGLPSSSTWDYFYVNSTENSNSSMFFKLYDSHERGMSFYILYPKVGTWCIGLRQVNVLDPTTQTTMSMSLERCPQKCSSHGRCQHQYDISGSWLFSYCDCDRNHGGFDCSIELVTTQGAKDICLHHPACSLEWNKQEGHIRQSIFLIASNAAAVLPAYRALRNKAFAEWVLFTCSGISSALYHACDVGTWCAMSFHVLQFLDFWLSFMAVVCTFVFLSTISEASKRTIHTIVAIITALLAETGPTRASNIGYVLGIGTLGLLVAWLIEFCTNYRSFSFSTEFHLNLVARWETVKQWIHDIIKTIRTRFRWGYIIAGFVVLSLAATSWTLESTESYWIWHSMWHLSIYTSSFLFLSSKTELLSCENEASSDQQYELTRQNSSVGGERRA